MTVHDFGLVEYGLALGPLQRVGQVSMSSMVLVIVVAWVIIKYNCLRPFLTKWGRFECFTY
jgi:hypothetical protein